MPTSRTVVRKGLQAIEDAANERCREVAEWVVLEIATNPNTPDGQDVDKPNALKLRYSYYVATDPVTGEALIKCRRRYWVFVEFGTGRGPEQPHLRPALELARSWFR